MNKTRITQNEEYQESNVESDEEEETLEEKIQSQFKKHLYWKTSNINDIFTSITRQTINII